jgi:acyl-[acyl-carrier-protein]-phospholipid O-acyltransferase/long-chain-fatty-acid--[acyl-carrier-protein] ligase
MSATPEAGVAAAEAGAASQAATGGDAGYGALVRDRGFMALMATVFLGAVTDNIYRIVVALFATRLALDSQDSTDLALGTALFVVPYLLFSGYAGYIADRYDKRRVLIAVKAMEIGAMALGLLALSLGRMDLMLVVIFLTALQSALFAPAHYGILPEILPESAISRANGLDQLCTFLAIVIGSALGAAMSDVWSADPLWIGGALIALAVVGSAFSLGISRGAAPATRRPFPRAPWGEVFQGIRRLHRVKPLWLTVLGISYFWFLGALLQTGNMLMGEQLLALSDTEIGLMNVAVAVGIAIGSMAAGQLSGDHVEFGLVPLGSLGIALGSLLLAAAPPSYGLTLAALGIVGFFGGLFIVPLNAFLQLRAGAEERGQLIAANNFLNMLGVMLASGVLWVLSNGLRLRADDIVLAVGLVAFAVTAFTMLRLGAFFARFVLWLLTHSLYRIAIVGRENLPRRGPALLVCNHLSFVDGLLVGAAVPRFVRFIMHRAYYDMPLLNRLFRAMQAIPVGAGNPKLIGEAFARAREALQEGHAVCIFAEGALSRSGNMLPFRKGVERILEGLNVPVIPVHLDRVWGSIFSFKDGRFFWKWPRRLPLPVTVSFGRALPATASAWEMRQAIQALGAAAFRHRRGRDDLLHLQFLRTAKRLWRKPCIADSAGARLSFGRALVGGLALARRFRRERADEPMVGVLLPASAGGVLANAGLSFAGKVPVNLNFSLGEPAMEAAIAHCGIRTIVSSRRFLEKAKIAPRGDMVFLEDLAGKISGVEKLWLALAARLLPRRLLIRLFDLRRQKPEDPAAVLFSSGSTGQPKGVVLSHHAILSNIEGVGQVLWIAPKDRMLGVLPFFHAFGLTATLWLPLTAGIGAIYHPNPLDGKTIGRLARESKATIFISTPTFCQSYLKAIEPEALRSLRHAVVGAEKLQPKLAEAFRARFGVRLMEGYGCTEMGPVVAVNVPDMADRSVRHVGHKPGSVGHPIPGVAARVVDAETGVPLPADAEGLLLVTGGGRMSGYLGDPERTAQVLRDGWYVTGDIAAIDEDGFIRIADRLARFSKIGGEMVPHGRLEEAAMAAAGVTRAVAVALPDAARGEKLALLYAGEDATPEAVGAALAAAGLPNLWIPKHRDIHRVADLPLLATGKIDLRKARETAQRLSGGPEP